MAEIAIRQDKLLADESSCTVYTELECPTAGIIEYVLGASPSPVESHQPFQVASSGSPRYQEARGFS